MLELMDLRELMDPRYLVAIADCLSFSRAADECAATQATLSIPLETYISAQCKGVALDWGKHWSSAAA